MIATNKSYVLKFDLKPWYAIPFWLGCFKWRRAYYRIVYLYFIFSYYLISVPIVETTTLNYMHSIQIIQQLCLKHTYYVRTLNLPLELPGRRQNIARVYICPYFIA